MTVEPEYDRADHREKLSDWVRAAEDQHEKASTKGLERDLSEALYAFSETGEIEDGVDPTEAIRIWAIVETVRRDGFPKSLRM